MSYYSLYGHCSDFLVNKGDPVKREQPVAMVGDISSLKGTTLYFEIRYKTKKNLLIAILSTFRVIKLDRKY